MDYIEVRVFGKLWKIFQERGYAIPFQYQLAENCLSADNLREKLEIPAEDVEAVFINRHIRPLSTKLEPGDRVAFVPPGIPSIHRFNLGFYAAREGEEDSSVCREENRGDE